MSRYEVLRGELQQSREALAAQEGARGPADAAAGAAVLRQLAQLQHAALRSDRAHSHALRQKDLALGMYGLLVSKVPATDLKR